MRTRITLLVVGLGISLLALGTLRAATLQEAASLPLAGFITPAYIVVVASFTFALVRAGLPLNRIGFGDRPGRRHVLLAIVAIALLRVTAVTLEPLWETLLSGPRNVDRFSHVQGSPVALAGLLAVSWSVAAFGEEIAYRIVLMRGIAFVMGDSRAAAWLAVFVQALLFGMIHAYQGTTGIASAATHGLIFGAVTLLGRWSIWPAAMAHGVNNTIGILSLYRG